MKNLKFIFLCVVFLFVSGLNSSCKSIAPVSSTEQKGNEFTSAYVCPMNCRGSGSADVGKCPICELDYVKNDKHN